ncbi:hypothetical protein [Thioalkalivibrio sp. XN279]|uniref:hypothetical protein n=1 Tax=Thioalkalivibrio sp. XN279 TaxID=2714953 RepID=UPI001407D10C|nr:hypothetical protein [Thioalkalivibrio sp. XN279]NHA14844.1 hypothetical protein [Thioalkalivibrio sp. XN279]
MANNNTDAGSTHAWRFFRCGGFDQVAIETGEDLRHLSELDPKLWTALSCPTTGLEFDARTLALLDTDGDGQIRVPEIVAAVDWACRMVKDPQALFGDGALPVEAIDDSHEEGAVLKAAATQILGYLGKSDVGALSVPDFADMTKMFSPEHVNGDGVVPAGVAGDEGLAQVIGDIIATQGGVPDRSGEPGITAETLEAFFTEAEAVLAWRHRAAESAELILPLGDATAGAAEAFEAVRAKVDDYFARCRLAAFDPRAAEGLNAPVAVYGMLGERVIGVGDAEVAALPLAEIVADKPLPLAEGMNPAWAEHLAQLHDEVVQPLLGARETLTLEAWLELSARFDAYRAWMADRPATAVHDIELAQLETIVADDTRTRLAALIERDLRAEASAANIDAVERLVRYQRDLVTLLRNFVTLSEFYGGEKKAIFQAGTLYLDQRSCELVMRVSDMAKHASLAPFSGCYLVYCSCVRAGAGPIEIVAALTGGEVDELMVPGRNGMFCDREGVDWKATVVKVVEQPVSIRQAFWSPYRRVGAMIENQLRKFAASRDKDMENKAAANVAGAAVKAEGGQAAAPPFDIAKFAGIFAAIGLAVGAIGTALAAAIAGLFSLAWWQLPLVLVAMVAIISGPSMLLAWLTLRRRNLGPLLDANGWAVNARARINLPFGESLTGLAELPAGSKRSLHDPFADRKRPWKTWLLLVALVVLLLVLWRQGVFAGLFGG